MKIIVVGVFLFGLYSSACTFSKAQSAATTGLTTHQPALTPPSVSSPISTSSDSSGLSFLQEETRKHREFIENFYDKVFQTFAWIFGALAVVISIFAIKSLRDVKKLVDKKFDDEINQHIEAKLKDVEKRISNANIALFEARRLAAEAIRQCDERQKKFDHEVSALIKINEGSIYYSRELYQLAVNSFTEALKEDPQSERALIGLATSLSSTSTDYSKPIEILEEVISKNGKSALAFYNLACIRFIADGHIFHPKVQEYLRKSFTLEPACKESAILDTDWDLIRESSEFRKLFE